MADKIKLMKKWFDDLKEDPNVGSMLGPEEMAIITYAVVQYGFTGEKINIGKIFGSDKGMLNFVMPNIYGQVDNIQDYAEKMAGICMYDANAIYELALQGKKAKEVCEILGYPVEKANNITSNKGWVAARKELKAMKNSEQKNPESGFSVKSVKNNQESTQNQNFDFEKENPESVQSGKRIPESIQKSNINFNF